MASACHARSGFQSVEAVADPVTIAAPRTAKSRSPVAPQPAFAEAKVATQRRIAEMGHNDHLTKRCPFALDRFGSSDTK
jgi:hypothetical protein